MAVAVKVTACVGSTLVPLGGAVMVTTGGVFWLKVTVPPDAHQGQYVNSYVVVEIKGPNPRRFRIPVKGSGTR